MVTWLRKFSYSKVAKSIAFVILTIAALMVIQVGMTLGKNFYEDSYYETWQFEQAFITKAGFVRDKIVRYMDKEIFDAQAISQEDVDKRIEQSPELQQYVEKVELKRNRNSSNQSSSERPIITEPLADNQNNKSLEHTEEVTTTYAVEEEWKSEQVENIGVSGMNITYSDGEVGYVDYQNERVSIQLTEEIQSKFEQQARVGIIKDRKKYSSEIELALSTTELEYFAVQRGTDKVITNVEMYDGTNAEEVIQMLQRRAAYLRGNGARIELLNTKPYQGGFYQYYYNGEEFAEQYNYEIHTAVSPKKNPNGVIYNQYIEFERTKGAAQVSYAVALVGVLMGVTIGIYGLKVVGRKSADDEKVYMIGIDKVPFEIQGAVAGFSLLIWMLCLSIEIMGGVIRHGWMPFKNLGYQDIMNFIVLYIMVVIAVSITLIPLTSFIRHMKNHSLKESILVIKLGRWTMKGMIYSVKEETLVLWTIAGFICYMVINGILWVVVINAWDLGFILALGTLGIFNLLVMSGILKLVIDYTHIARASKKIAEGNLETKVTLKYTLPIMKRMAENLNNIGEGLEEAVDQTVKSERLKTELITNVSHDLKTPLTSIISYIDLLKDEAIDNVVAKEYIEVLSERSSRLKHLVEDLVEASKAATGNVKAELTELELSQLVVQAVGEYNDRLEQIGLEIIMNPLEEVNILADGRHMWRVIENLLSNVSKYAMPNTRVYIEVRKEEEYAKLTMKNISKESLHLLDPSELTERFVRGDDSRTTEGSGLGLAIAQSLTTLQGGCFKIELDGDLFKMEILLPRVVANSKTKVL